MTGPRVTNYELREALRRQVKERPVRELAEEVGIRSHSALQRFIQGETESPQRETRKLLMHWYFTRDAGRATIPRDVVENAKATIEAWIDEPKSQAIRERRRRRIIEELSGVSKPAR